MTNKEAINELQSYINDTCGSLKEAIKMAIDALEKQTPQKPDLEGDGYGDNGELVYDTGYCRNCRHEFEVYYDATKCCPNCGQYLDWSDIEDLNL